MVAVRSGSIVDGVALARRQALTGASGPMALVKNIKVFGIACFACLGGYDNFLYLLQHISIKGIMLQFRLRIQPRSLLGTPHHDFLWTS